MTKEQRLAQREELLKKVSYFHLQVFEGMATTVGYEKEDTGELMYAIALCAPADQFSRKEGRKIAFARLIDRVRGKQYNRFDLTGLLSNESLGLPITSRLRIASAKHLLDHCMDDEAPLWIRKIFESGSGQAGMEWLCIKGGD